MHIKLECSQSSAGAVIQPGSVQLGGERARRLGEAGWVRRRAWKCARLPLWKKVGGWGRKVIQMFST